VLSDEFSIVNRNWFISTPLNDQEIIQSRMKGKCFDSAQHWKIVSPHLPRGFRHTFEKSVLRNPGESPKRDEGANRQQSFCLFCLFSPFGPFGHSFSAWLLSCSTWMRKSRSKHQPFLPFHLFTYLCTQALLHPHLKACQSIAYGVS